MTEHEDASPEERERIKNACRDGRIVCESLDALDRVLHAAHTGQKPDFTVTDVELAECWAPSTNNSGGFRVYWETVSAGFGETTFFLKGGKLHCDNEAMGRDFIKKVMAALVDQVELRDE